jgi:hypothetical protein
MMSGGAGVHGHQHHEQRGCWRRIVPAGPARLAGRGVALMPWARVDDGFDDHPKVLALLEHDDGAAAIGLWTLCLTWAHRNTRRKGKIPGRIPGSLPRRYLGSPGRSAAKLLTDAGLWNVAEDGWDIHDFADYLPTAETSTARAEAGRRGAAARWGRQGKTAGADDNLPPADGKLSSDVMANDGNAMAPDSSGMASAATEAATAPLDTGDNQTDGNLPFLDGSLLSVDGNPIASDGSRTPARRAISKEIAPTPDPDPSSQTPSKDSPSGSPPARPKAARATRLPENFTVTAEMAEWARVEVPGIIGAGRGKSETDKFIDHWRSSSGASARKLDWVAAWRNWMRNAEDRMGSRDRPGRSAMRGGQADDLSGEVYGQGRTKV